MDTHVLAALLHCPASDAGPLARSINAALDAPLVNGPTGLRR